jgi:hypothetical protein
MHVPLIFFQNNECTCSRQFFIYSVVHKSSVGPSFGWFMVLNATFNKILFILWRLGPSWSSTYGSWIYNYLCNQCLSPLTLWVWIMLRLGVIDTTLCDKVCQWLPTGWWFSPGTLVSSINKTDCHDIL